MIKQQHRGPVPREVCGCNPEKTTERDTQKEPRSRCADMGPSPLLNVEGKGFKPNIQHCLHQGITNRNRVSRTYLKHLNVNLSLSGPRWRHLCSYGICSGGLLGGVDGLSLVVLSAQITGSTMPFFFFLTSLLEYNCFTMVC